METAVVVVLIWTLLYLYKPFIDLSHLWFIKTTFLFQTCLLNLNIWGWYFMVTESELYVKDISESRMSPYTKYLHLWNAHKMSLQLESMSGNSIFSSITCSLKNSLPLELLTQCQGWNTRVQPGEILSFILDLTRFCGCVDLCLTQLSVFLLKSLDLTESSWLDFRALLSVSIPNKNTKFLTVESPYCSAWAIGLHIVVSQWFILTISLGKCNLFCWRGSFF